MHLATDPGWDERTDRHDVPNNHNNHENKNENENQNENENGVNNNQQQQQQQQQPTATMVIATPPCNDPACELRSGCAGRETEEVENAQSSNSSSDPSNPCALAEKCISSCQAYGRVCPCTARRAAQAACRAVSALSTDSKIFATKPELHDVDCDDLIIGEKLGEGGFSVVHKVTLRNNNNNTALAVKYLRRQVMVERHPFAHGASDLAVEAHFLAALHHPHIVTIHGVAAGSVESNVASGKECGFFILIDRLECTLEDRIATWKAEIEKKYQGKRFAILSAEKKEKRRLALMERLRVAVQIIDAIDYLHGLGIVYRDLKPDNIGFDEKGTVKLFDFGLAKELKEADKQDDGAYKLSGKTGSRRYMSPEVTKETPYGLPVDVYSFAILLWELCALDKPFFGFSPGIHLRQVALGGERPRLDSPNTSWWPVPLQWLLQKCWAADPSARLKPSKIKETLQAILSGSTELPSSAAADMHGLKGPTIAPPKGGFAGLKPSAARGRRSKTTPGGSEPRRQRGRSNPNQGGRKGSLGLRWRQKSSGTGA